MKSLSTSAIVAATAAFLWLAGAGIAAAQPFTPHMDPGGPVVTQPIAEPPTAQASKGKYVSGSAADGNPERQQICDQFADVINESIDSSVESVDEGDFEGAEKDLDIADAAADRALSSGCDLMYES